jgi:hypothetical protein
MDTSQIHTRIFWLIVLNLPIFKPFAFKMMQNPKIAKETTKNMVKIKERLINTTTNKIFVPYLLSKFDRSFVFKSLKKFAQAQQ